MAAGYSHSDDKDRVRDASDIVAIIGEHLSLKPQGREYLALCPFHDDRKPSMTVSKQKQLFKCFACGAGGDVFSFVMKFHAMDFREALEYLAERASITLTKRAPDRAAPSSDAAPDADGYIDKKSLAAVNAAAAEFFRLILNHDEHGSAARAVIARRAISPEMVEAFALGAAPPRWDGLALTAQKRGLDPRALLEVGLLKRRDSGDGMYDAFRNRLMFPIHDQLGRVIAFGARKIDEADEPKYLNSPESALFDKSATLYGLHQASREIQRQRLAIITEGYTDTIACHQAGLTNAVATLGTALTPRHAAVLRRFCDTVVLMFDGDAAGQRAADRAVEVFFRESIDLKICTLAGHTDAKDPDELLKRENGRATLERAIAAAPDVLKYRYDRIKDRLAGAGLSAVNSAIEQELARLVELGLNDLPVMRRMLIIKRIAQIVGVPEQAIAQSIPAGRVARPAALVEPKSIGFGHSAQAIARSPRAEALGCLLIAPALWSTLTDRQREDLDPSLFAGSAHDLADTMFAVAARRGSCSLADLLAATTDPEVQALATELALKMERLGSGEVATLALYLKDALSRLDEDQPAATGLSDLRRRAAGGTNRRTLPGGAGPSTSGSS